MCSSILPACVPVQHIPAVPGRPEEGDTFPGIGIMNGCSNHIHTGNRTRVLCKNKKYP